MRIMMNKEEIVKYCCDRKTFDSALTYRAENLKEFFRVMMDEKNYLGPFRKSIFVQHTKLIRKCKELGITLRKSQRDRNYYIMQPAISKPVLFDPSFIDEAEED